MDAKNTVMEAFKAGGDALFNGLDKRLKESGERSRREMEDLAVDIWNAAIEEAARLPFDADVRAETAARIRALKKPRE